MTDSERIKTVLKYSGMSANKFAKHVGLKSPQVLYDVTNGRNGIFKDLADKITAKCVNISLSWLLTDEGEMLKSESMNEQSSDSSTVLPSIETKRLIELGAEAFEKKLLDMFQKGEIYSAATVKEKDLLIHELLIKVGKLEAKVEELEKEKGNVRTDENATCANVG